MSVQLFGVDINGKQVYECHIQKPKEAKKTAENILEGMSHVNQIVAIENVPNISQIEDTFHISYQSRFLFIETRR